MCIYTLVLHIVSRSTLSQVQYLHRGSADTQRDAERHTTFARWAPAKVLKFVEFNFEGISHTFRSILQVFEDFVFGFKIMGKS